MEKIEPPSEAGVYIFKDRDGKVLYVGKAVNLRNRLKSYFSKSGDTRFLFPHLVEEIKEIEWIITETEKEALLLEEKLIKKFKPKFNVKLRDDKTYVNLIINVSHKFPGVWIERRPKKDGNLVLGPFSSVRSLREFLDVAVKAFKIRTCSDREFASRKRPCIEYEMKRCLAPCAGYVNESEYRENLNRLIGLFTGKGNEILEELKNKMMEFSEREEFEKAAQVRDTIRAIEKTLEKERVYTGSEGDMDFIGIKPVEDSLFISVLSVRNGSVEEVSKFTFRKTINPDEEISMFILQFYNERKYLPSFIIMRNLPPESSFLSEILSERGKKSVIFKEPSDEKEIELLEFAEKNARSQMEMDRKKETMLKRTLLELKEKFRLSNFPVRIECFDVSNLFGEDAGASRVTFIYGEPLKSEYRRYKIESKEINDYGMLYEVLKRRLRDGKERGDLPDLIIIDGGKGHLGIGMKAIEEEGLKNIDVISIAKGRRRMGIGDRVYTPRIMQGITISPASRVGRLLMRIRDEAHRFAIEYHRKRREKGLTELSLLKIPGIGEKRAKLLLSKYLGFEGIINAPADEISALLRISHKKAEELKEAVKKLSTS